MRQTFKRERNSVISVMREAAKAQTGAGRSGLESTSPPAPAASRRGNISRVTK